MLRDWWVLVTPKMSWNALPYRESTTIVLLNNHFIPIDYCGTQPLSEKLLTIVSSSYCSKPLLT